MASCRFIYQNKVLASGVVLSSASIQQSLPLSNLLDPLMTKTARSKAGWDVVAGFNDAIDFSVSSTQYNATIAAGTYATGAAYATAVQTAMTAAHANAWSVTYNAGTGIFTVSGTSPFIFLFATGTNAATTGSYELGMGGVGDYSSGGGTSLNSLSATYQSRHWFLVDLGSAIGIQAAIIAGHNSGSAGTWTISGNATGTFPALATPSFGPQTLTVGSVTGQGIRYNYFGSTQTYRYWLLGVNDTGNKLGYSEVGVLYLGPYLQPTFNYSSDFKYDYLELSVAEDALGGAIYVDTRGQPRAVFLKWTDLAPSDRDALTAVAVAVKQGGRFFFNFDTTTPGDTTYLAFGNVHSGSASRASIVVSVQYKPGIYYDVSMNATEVVES